MRVSNSNAMNASGNKFSRQTTQELQSRPQPHQLPLKIGGGASKDTLFKRLQQSDETFLTSLAQRYVSASAAEAQALDNAHWVGNAVGPGRQSQLSQSYSPSSNNPKPQARAEEDALFGEADALFASHDLAADADFVPYDESHTIGESSPYNTQYAVGSSTNMEALSRTLVSDSIREERREKELLQQRRLEDQKWQNKVSPDTAKLLREINARNGNRNGG